MSSSKNKETNFLVVITVFISVIILSGIVFYQLLPKQNSFIFSDKQTDVYILVSDENEIYLNSIGTSVKFYENNLEKFKNKLSKIGINALFISEKEIKSLNNTDILFILDTYYLSDNTLNSIKKFLSEGGNLIFNYNFGFVRNSKYIKAKSIEEITGLKFVTDTIPKNETKFFVPKILSPLTFSKNDKRHDLVLYGTDTLPIFKSVFTPDAVLTDWSITSTPKYKNKNLPLDNAGLIWHGFYKKGKWFYFSFPSYVFTDMQNTLLKRYLTNIFNYFRKSVTVAKYPFIDAKNAVFISEDTEYKYKNMIYFAKLSKEFNIPVTLFCVAKLALKNRQITKQASALPNIEIGSHSYTHTKILGASREKVIKEIKESKEVLENITGKQIYGFRPPREQIDKTMEKVLRDAGYKYFMSKTKPFLLPKEEYENLITIPRHGTDDYMFLINLNWDDKKILQKMIQETNLLTSLNSVYTLSIHTHLLGYKKNLDIIKKYLAYLRANYTLNAFKGIEITDRIKLSKNITITSQDLNDQTFIYIHNDNDVEINNLKLRIFWPNASKITITPEITSTKLKILQTNSKRKFTDIQIIKIRPNSTISLIIGLNNE
jgi:peptidoglycan/xylan/chitin deacetylase (PgdA/CDA1 family)